MNAQNDRKISDYEHILIEYILFILHALPGLAVVACAEMTTNHCIIVEKKKHWKKEDDHESLINTRKMTTRSSRMQALFFVLY